MTSEITHIHGVTVLNVLADEAPIASEADFMDPLGNAAYQGAEWVVLPIEALAPIFFDLKSKVAGEILQKLMNYNLKCAIIGDLSEYIQKSTALRDFVYECNNGNQIAFIETLDIFQKRLANG